MRQTKTPLAGICLLYILHFIRIILHALFAKCIFENLSEEHTHLVLFSCSVFTFKVVSKHPSSGLLQGKREITKLSMHVAEF